MVKDLDEHQIEEMHREDIWEGGQLPTMFRHTTPPAYPCVHQPGSTPDPVLWDFMIFSSGRHHGFLTSFSALLPLWGKEGGQS